MLMLLVRLRSAFFQLNTGRSRFATLRFSRRTRYHSINKIKESNSNLIGHIAREPGVITLGDDSGVDLGIVGQHGTMGNIGSAVLNSVHAPVFVDKQTQAIIGGIPTGQNERCEHLLDNIFAADLAFAKITDPFRQIAHSGVNPTGSGGGRDVPSLGDGGLGELDRAHDLHLAAGGEHGIFDPADGIGGLRRAAEGCVHDPHAARTGLQAHGNQCADHRGVGGGRVLGGVIVHADIGFDDHVVT